MKHLPRLLALLLVAGLIYFFVNLQPVDSKDSKRREFRVDPHTSLDQIITDLRNEKLIRSRFTFKLMVYVLNVGKKIQSGYFYLSPSMSAADIANSLTHAVPKQVWLTVPEGLRHEEIANLVVDTLKNFNVKSQFDPDQFVSLSKNLEGQLFPDTYSLPDNLTAQKLVDILHNRFLEIFATLNVPEKDKSTVIILASLLEREAGSDAERPEIAGVLMNRLNGKWPLQIDATVQYALANSRCRIRICDWWPKNLTKADLALNSPFNTYKNQGLPPAPISNPGKASLTAAAHPAVNKFWFYLHDSNGQIHFAVTVADHNKNVCTYLKKDCP